MRAQAAWPAALVRRTHGDEWLMPVGLSLLAATVLAVGLLYLRMASTVATGGYDVLRLEGERQRWEVANQQLRYQVMELSSLARVEREASQTLKMTPPKATVYLRARTR